MALCESALSELLVALTDRERSVDLVRELAQDLAHELFSILEPCRRIDRALYAVVMDTDVSGVSRRSVDALVESMGAASGICRSEMWRLCTVRDDALG